MNVSINNYLAKRLHGFEESVFSVMTKLSHQHKAINLSQGYPNFDGPDFIKEAAKKAIDHGWNQYTPSTGLPTLRRAIARNNERLYGYQVNPDTDISVTCGATEALFSTIAALIDPGDEVITFEPYYESYPPIVAMAGGTLKAVTLSFPECSFDREKFVSLITDKTKLIIFNTPHNPSGKVFNQDELSFIAEVASKYNLLVVTDEVYEHLFFEDNKHIPIACLPGMRDRTITISSTAKTFSFTGWKIGYIITNEVLNSVIQRAHQHVTFCTAAPLQEAMAHAIDNSQEYLLTFRKEYQSRRDTLVNILKDNGFIVSQPQGTYFMLADFSAFNFKNDMEFALHLTQKVGVSVIPVNAFYSTQDPNRRLVRFAFCKSCELLEEAGKRLSALVKD